MEIAKLNYLWINQIGDRIVGMARLVQNKPNEARLVLFHVDPEWHHTKIPEKLFYSILSFCRSHGCLFVILPPNVLPPWMLSLLDHLGYHVIEQGKLRRQTLQLTRPVAELCHNN
jgi:hypothetical protein